MQASKGKKHQVWREEDGDDLRDVPRVRGDDDDRDELKLSVWHLQLQTNKVITFDSLRTQGAPGFECRTGGLGGEA